ncbi:hypothetical protein HAX54_039914, partial [Datura stramonium]|nr:hypothetical protein [Datura stramonium]
MSGLNSLVKYALERTEIKAGGPQALDHRSGRQPTVGEPLQWPRICGKMLEEGWSEYYQYSTAVASEGSLQRDHYNSRDIAAVEPNILSITLNEVYRYERLMLE